MCLIFDGLNMVEVENISHQILQSFCKDFLPTASEGVLICDSYLWSSELKRTEICFTWKIEVLASHTNID